VDISIDGVPETKSGGSGISLTMVCLRFFGCRKVWPWHIIRKTEKGYRLDVETVLRPIVKSLNDLGVTVEVLVADAPMRAFARNQKTHAGYFVSEAMTHILSQG
jgi:hypothetical protein